MGAFVPKVYVEFMPSVLMVAVAEYMIDKRNGLPLTSLGDKSYTIPEYSEDFHKLATCPVPGYG